MRRKPDQIHETNPPDQSPEPVPDCRWCSEPVQQGTESALLEDLHEDCEESYDREQREMYRDMEYDSRRDEELERAWNAEHPDQ